jgi:hypothetical protein
MMLGAAKADSACFDTISLRDDHLARSFRRNAARYTI